MMKTFSWELSVLAIIFFVFLSGSAIVKSPTISPEQLFGQGQSIFREIYVRIASPEVYSLFKTILGFLATFFISIIFYCAVRMHELRKKEHMHLHHEIQEYAKRRKEEGKLKGENGVSQNERWNKTLTYLFSDSSSDWKLAIVEADAMLEDLSRDLGFKGDSLGERLKMANQDNFRGLSSAWEAHAVRNRIAHEGLNFELSHHEAKRVIALYEQIFRNYGYI